MNKLFLVIGFTAVMVSIWVILLSQLGGRECPDTLTSDYYSCNEAVDCYFHPKYECINAVKPLGCVINEDLSARQAAASLFECQCINSQCVTQIIH